MRKIIAMTLFAVGIIAAPVVRADNEAAEELNELLRGELSAVETYKQALETVSRPELKKALADHEKAVSELQAQVKAAGGTPAESSGVWGTWTQAVTGTAKAISDETALRALREGEQHGVDEYKDALEEEEVPVVAKNLIKEKLLPNQQKHIGELDKLIATM